MLSKIIALSLIASAAAGGALTKCDSDGDCPSSYCMKSAGKSAPFTCHDCGANCCNSDVDCKGSYCMKDQTKKAPFQCHAAVGATMVEVAAPVTNWTSCGTQNDRLITTKAALTGDFKAGASASFTASGNTNLHGVLSSGAWQVRVYEDGVPKESSTSVGDLMKALKFNSPSNPTTFSLALDFALPKKQSTGKFTASIVGTDQAKSEYFCLEVNFAYAAAAPVAVPTWVLGMAGKITTGCTSDKECPSSYCQHGTCHTCGDACCLKDSDCPNSYCSNDDTKTPPYVCHGALLTQFNKLVAKVTAKKIITDHLA